MQEDVEILKVLTGCTDESLLGVLLEDAKETVLSYTNRKNLISQLRKPMRDLAPSVRSNKKVILRNRGYKRKTCSV